MRGELMNGRFADITQISIASAIGVMCQSARGNRQIRGALRMKQDHYSYRVTWSAEDQAHVGLCVEFASLSWLAPTPEKALAGIRKVVAEVVADMQTAGETVPVPLAEKQFSGRFVVRVPGSVHRALTIEAAEQGVSLNRLVSAKLS